MPRPRKCRNIKFIPNVTEFVPKGNVNLNGDVVILSLEELEAIRLIDLEGLDQEKSSIEMGISRGTFQRILNLARNKVAKSLINGNKLVIQGGNYSIKECVYVCDYCNYEFKSNGEGKLICPNCHSENYRCRGRKKFCLENCNRFRGGK